MRLNTEEMGCERLEDCGKG